MVPGISIILVNHQNDSFEGGVFMKHLANLVFALVFLINQTHPTLPLPSGSNIRVDSTLPTPGVLPTATPSPLFSAYPPPPTATPPVASPTPTVTPTPQPTLTTRTTPTPTPTPAPIPVELLSLPAQLVPIEGTTLTAFDGLLRLTFPKGALTEDAQVWITRADPPVTLSGTPFQVLARGVTSQLWITRFALPLEFELHLGEHPLSGDVRSLTLYYFDESAREWIPLPSWVDLPNKTLHATSDHLTIFDFDLQNWQAARLPALNGEVAAFTGAATYSYPFQLPEGPGGLKPGLALTYNSQAVDAATLQTQAGWVGMGWSLETGFIERNQHGTPDYREDDTFSLNAGGISSPLLPGADGYYHTTDKSFWRIQWESSTNNWKAWDKQGNRYDFENKAAYPTWEWDGSTCQYAGSAVWRWSLTRVHNTHGQDLVYTYTGEQQATQHPCEGDNPPYHAFDHAIYPATIRYPHQRYQVRFELEARQDYNTGWIGTGSRVFYQKSRLKNLYVEYDSDGNLSFETLIRRYAFIYSTDTATRIFPGHVWSGGAANLTLGSVQEFGLNGASLPATSFTYDGLHLVETANGYGGRLQFSYESAPWYETNGAPLSTSILEDMGVWLAYRTSACDNVNDPGDVGEWNGVYPARIKCSGGWLEIKGGEANKRIPLRLVRPGGRYIITARHGTSPLRLGLRDGSSLTLKPASTANPLTEVFNISPTTSGENVRAAAYCTACGLDSYDIRLVTSRYRVTVRRVYDGIQDDPVTTTSTYGTPDSNDPAPNGLYPNVSACLDDNPTNDTCYEEPYSQFRGHAWTQVTGPDGKQVTTWFYQQIETAGKSYQSETRNGDGALLLQTLTTWLVDDTCDGFCVEGSLPHPEGSSTAFVDLALRWVKMADVTEKRQEAGDSLDLQTKTTHEYNPANQGGTQYGNLTRQTIYQTMLAGTPPLPSLAPVRTTLTGYYPNPNGSEGRQLTGLPAYSETYACDDLTCTAQTLLAESWTLYDNATALQKTVPPTAGIPTARRTRVNATGFSDETYSYDAWGNLATATRYSGYGTSTALAATGAQTASTTYDPETHTYPTAQVNALGHTTAWVYDLTLGVPTQVTDANNAVTTASYDAFGRLVRIVRPDDSDASPSVTMEYHDTTPFWTQASQKMNDTQSSVVRKFFNGLGELIQTQQVGAVLLDDACSTDADTDPDACTVVVDSRVDYASSQKRSRQSMPYAAAAPAGWIAPTWDDVTQTLFDELGRPVSITAPDGTVTGMDYAIVEDASLGRAASVLVTNPMNAATQTLTDGLGRTRKVVPPAGPGVSYLYDALDRLVSATYGAGTTALSYDLAGRKLSQDDPDMGDWSYTYDALANLTGQTDARGCHTSLAYDALNRLTEKTYSNCPAGVAATGAISYTYDSTTDGNAGTGRRTGMVDSSGSSAWVYDSRGRLVTETLAITGVGTYTTRRTYNSADQLASMTYPNGEIIYPSYNPQGWVTGVGSEFWVSYAMQAKYDEAGRLLGWTLGNGVKTSNTYSPWDEQGGRLESTSSITSQTPAATRQHLAYSYDANGNISAIQDYVANETLNYSYDLLDRLTGVSGAYSQSYGYSAATGNLASKAGQTLAYTDTNHPHAATGLGSNVYSYDANGNMTSRQISSGTYTLSYDAESRLVGILGGGMSAAYTYNGDGKRVKAVITNGSDTQITAYVGDYFEVSVGDPKPVTAPTPVDCSMTTCLYLPLVIASSPQIPAGHAWTSYYTAGSSRVAMRVKSNQDGIEDGVYYFLTDHLGSTTVTLDVNGNRLSELRYTAWGETRYTDGMTPTQRRYTGQLEAEAGLYFYNARWFDPGLGRFAQPDSIIPDIYNPLDIDRYQYVHSNPVNFNDPSGHMVSCGILCEGDFSPSVIFDTFSSSDDIDQNLRNFLRAYPNYIPETDQRITNSTKFDPGASLFLISIAKFQVSAENLANGEGSLWGTFSTGLAVGMAGVAIGGDESGIQAFKSFTSWNFRENLRRLTGGNLDDIVGMEAHHVLPQQFTPEFAKPGININIHDPSFGSWVVATDHHGWSYTYNAKWKKFFKSERTKEEILVFARQLSKEYGFDVHFVNR